ncbi:MAG TPA: glycosyltransferase [Candidatus Binatia bacterium]|nr:glycosyltransferase [Candidatus Binatia bacterium]
MPASASFGPNAVRWLGAYEPQRLTLAVEPEGAVNAYEEAVRLRAAGEGFDLALLWPDRRAHVAIAVAAQSLVDFPDYDKRRFALDAIAREQGQIKGQPITSLVAVDIATMTAMRDLILLADRLLVRSWNEFRRIVFEMGLAIPNIGVVELTDTSVPAVERAEPDGSVVVWAPFTPLPRLSIVVMALLELHRPVAYICGEGAISGIDIERVALPDAARALSRASSVVVADNDDPAPARALARLGIPLCVSTTSGAREYLAGARAFSPWDRGSILAAALEALGSAPPQERTRATLGNGVSARQPAAVKTFPLVSVVVRTYDKPRGFLERALRSVERQTYPHVETIVVNDAGPDVAALVERFAGARLITQPRNDYRKVTNAGMRQTNGVYVTRLDDDDVYFPEHLGLLVDMLERSGESVAFSDAVVAYVAGEPPLATSYLIVDKDPVEWTRMLAANQIVAPLLRMLIRRSMLERVGWFSESMFAADDYDLSLRLLRECDFLHLDRVTAMYTQFDDGSNLSASKDRRRYDAHRLIQAVHPVGDRPHLLDLRRNVLERLEREGNLGMRRPPWRFPQPVPLPGYVAEEPSRLTT